jgi:hypothetical protein
MSTENTNETEATAELAKPEDVTAYIEEREEQIAEKPRQRTRRIARSKSFGRSTPNSRKLERLRGTSA